MSILQRRAAALLAIGALALGGTAVPAGATTHHHHWSKAKCTRSYKKWKKSHKHATHKQKKAELKKLHKKHGCSTKLK